MSPVSLMWEATAKFGVAPVGIHKKKACNCRLFCVSIQDRFSESCLRQPYRSAQPAPLFAWDLRET